MYTQRWWNNVNHSSTRQKWEKCDVDCIFIVNSNMRVSNNETDGRVIEAPD